MSSRFPTRTRCRSSLDRFDLGCFGQFLRRVVLALVGGLFRPIFGASCFGRRSFWPKSIDTYKEYMTSMRIDIQTDGRKTW